MQSGMHCTVYHRLVSTTEPMRLAESGLAMRKCDMFVRLNVQNTNLKFVQQRGNGSLNAIRVNCVACGILGKGIHIVPYVLLAKAVTRIRSFV